MPAGSDAVDEDMDDAMDDAGAGAAMAVKGSAVVVTLWSAGWVPAESAVTHCSPCMAKTAARVSSTSSGAARLVPLRLGTPAGYYRS